MRPDDKDVEKAVERLDREIERAYELDLIGRMLCAAHEDERWRKALEAALRTKGPLGSLMTGGARAENLWSQSLLRRRVVNELKTVPATFVLFAGLQPDVAALRADGCDGDDERVAQLEPLVRVMAAYVLSPTDFDAQAEAIRAACDEVEREQALGIGTDDCADVGASVAEEGPEVDAEVVRLLEARVSELSAGLGEQEKTAKALRKELRQRVDEVRRKDRKAAELREQVKSLGAELALTQNQLREVREERDELGRQVARLTSHATSSLVGKTTIEKKAADEAARAQQTIADLKERLSASSEVSNAVEKRLSAVEAALDDERARRLELEEVLEAMGFEEIASSSASLQTALDALVRFKGGLQAYVARQEQREKERLRLLQEAEAEKLAAEEARRAQQEVAAAWQLREADRLQELETELFPDGAIDHIIIDGHNLIHRIFRPDAEASTRPWLEELVEIMAGRLEERGWQSQVHLVFDTQYQSSERPAAHGVRVYFAKNNGEGGADAKIAALLRDGHPQAAYMVVSTDRKHIWADSLEFMRSEGAEVDLVQVELLAQYLQTLDEVVNRRSRSQGSPA